MMQEEKIAELYKKIIKPNFIVLDIGAFDGTHSEILCNLAYNGQVYCFEPNLINFQTIRSKLFYKNLNLINKAVSNFVGNLGLYHGRDESLAECNIRGKDLNEEKTNLIYEVPSITIDSLFEDKHVDFIKIDVEGAENLVIEGAIQTIQKNKPIMIIEFHTDEGWKGAKQLFEIGYKIINVYSGEFCLNIPQRQCYHGICVPIEENILL